MIEKIIKNKKNLIIVGVFILVLIIIIVGFREIKKNREKKYLAEVTSKEMIKRNNPGPVLEIINNIIASHPFAPGTSTDISLLLISSDGQAHNLVFSDLSISKESISVGPNEIKSFILKAPVPGRYALSCTIPGHKEKGEKTQMIINTQPNKPESSDQKNDKNISELDLTVKNKLISPDTFVAKLGSPVLLTFISGDRKAHNIVFSNSELKAAELEIGPSGRDMAVFKIPVPGTYEFHCAIPGHEGEKGQMIVK